MSRPYRHRFKSMSNQKAPNDLPFEGCSVPVSTEGWAEVPAMKPSKAARMARQLEAQAKTVDRAHQCKAGPPASLQGVEISPSTGSELNARITERISASMHARPQDEHRGKDRDVKLVRQYHSKHVESYIHDQEDQNLQSKPWLRCPVVPTAKELLDLNEPWTNTQSTPDDGEQVVLQGNQLNGPWPSKNAYLSGHHAMLREETVFPLRNAIAWIKAFPTAGEDLCHISTIGIYSNVHITRVITAKRGLGFRVVFSLRKVGKQIRWEQSKRLVTGSLIALSPSKDMFKTKCLVAVVAARPMNGLRQNPPEIDIFFGNANDIEIDPTVEYTMLEDRAAFFEATRYTMAALQKMSHEPFPVGDKHLVEVNRRVGPPKYIKERPQRDLSAVFSNNDHPATSYTSVDILSDWPSNPETTLDKSQQNALRHLLTKRVSIIQGPPGTGKTHVSVVGLKVLIENMSIEDPPIIVACQTNHALDQLLRHISNFEPRFARLGGRSKDPDIVKVRTLYNLRGDKNYRIPGGMRKPAGDALKTLGDKILEQLSVLDYGKDYRTNGLLSPKILRDLRILTNAQYKSLEEGDPSWRGRGFVVEQPMVSWLGKYLEENKREFSADNFGFDFEEVDLEFEQLKEMEAENAADDDVEFDTLRGDGVSIWDAFVGKHSNAEDEEIEKWLQNDNMWKVKSRHRGAVFDFLQRKAKIIIRDRVRDLAIKYDENVTRFRAGGFEQDIILLRQQRVIGMTTTGLSKFRPLVAGLCPKIVMIEEAAETMEAPVIAACVPSLEHLILVGDHKQLRPQCGVKQMEQHPYYMNVSLFERLVNNNLPYKMLKRQRRMVPEIRSLLDPIYQGDIHDHASMRDPIVRPLVPGMGNVHSLFFSHAWPDAVDDQWSSTNVREADMIVGVFDYLIHNGLTEKEITILTFYNGQRKLILRKLREHHRLGNIGTDTAGFFQVLTVDSYQGEENEIILLSLVKNNDQGKIGFSGVENRVCVALSRAKRGLYMFGNAELLATESKIWAKILNIMIGDYKNGSTKCRVVFNFPIECSNHGQKTFISNAEEWDKVDGGCETTCNAHLPCGHRCELNCHPFSHSRVICGQPCSRALPCGHPCDRICSDQCHCPEKCGRKKQARSLLLEYDQNVNSEHLSVSSDSSNTRGWKDFAAGGYKEHDAMLIEQRRELYLQAQVSSLNASKAAEAAQAENTLTTASAAAAFPLLPLLDSKPQVAVPPASIANDLPLLLGFDDMPPLAMPLREDATKDFTTSTLAASVKPASTVIQLISASTISLSTSMGSVHTPNTSMEPEASVKVKKVSHRNRFKQSPLATKGMQATTKASSSRSTDPINPPNVPLPNTPTYARPNTYTQAFPGLSRAQGSASIRVSPPAQATVASLRLTTPTRPVAEAMATDEEELLIDLS